MLANEDYKITITVHDTGFTVTMPDLAAIKAQEQAKKEKAESSKDAYVEKTYFSDHTKTHACATSADVLKLVKAALAEEGPVGYNDSFAEASAKAPKTSL